MPPSAIRLCARGACKCNLKIGDVLSLPSVGGQRQRWVGKVEERGTAMAEMKPIVCCGNKKRKANERPGAEETMAKKGKCRRVPVELPNFIARGKMLLTPLSKEGTKVTMERKIEERRGEGGDSQQN
ncbi:hypothetical protein niasHT_023606 [Heterodera trifolii]|uniref:Uncharacterized protein n=1 Tax=Heterodera trifolii TaxID=157864 RepID=A0ABD2JK76_9BILA